MEPNNAMIRSRGLRAGSLIYVWLVVGFVLGTLVLLFPVRWLTSALHARNASQGLENGLVILLVVTYVAVSLLIAARLNRYICNHPKVRIRWTVLALATMVAVVTAWSWRNPGKMLSVMAGGGNIAAVKTAGGAVFEFGAYPDSARLLQLKAAGITTIISLQDADVVVEREGIAEEKRVTGEVGLQLVQAPMVPWFSENTQSLDKIRALAKSGKGHYYVHCGLGRDRVNIAKRVIEETGAVAVATTELREALGFEGRKWDFANGSLVSLDSGVWLVPYPGKEEMMGCIFEGKPGRVIALLDSTVSPQDSLLRDMHRLFPAYGVPFTVMSAKKPAEAAAYAKTLARPVTIIAYRTPWHNGIQKGDEAAIAFANAYRPESTWKITTTTPTEKRKLNQFTGGKETGC